MGYDQPAAYGRPADGSYDRLVRMYRPGSGPARDGRAAKTAGAVPALARQAPWAVAAGRVGIGLVALAWPSVPARPWVGRGSGDLAARVLGRALGARDLALGLGALWALRHQDAEPAPARAWVLAGALSDTLDVAASAASWRELPRAGRWPVVVSAGAAALTGAGGAILSEQARS